MKLKTLVLAFLLIIVTGISVGTLAYFTAEDTAHNVITTGGVTIDLIEHTRDDEGSLIPWPEEGVSGVMPGEDVAKIITVKNTGASAAWVRVKLTKVVTFEDKTETDTDKMITYEANTADWTEKDGWYYYNKVLKAGETTEALIEAVQFSTEMGNDYQNGVASLNVSAQAVQYDNNGKTVMDAAGWPIG